MPKGKSRWMERGILAAVCALVIGTYAGTARSGLLELLSLNAADTYYNSLVQGFRAGQLSLRKEVPPGFTQLTDPYDPDANAPYRAPPYRMLDMSYYKGRLYLYFGVTPALLLFWPFAALTGHYLFHRQAVVIFCAIGFLASVGLVQALWRRYFAEVSVRVVAAGVLALGLATGVPVMLQRSDVYEVPISCGYMLTMLALGAIWCSLCKPERRGRWLAAASVAYGLAVGARPSLLVGAAILLVPVAQAWRKRQRIGALLLAAVGPITLIGLGLMLYNYLRFDNPFEFGWRYELAGDHGQGIMRHFSLRYLWFNFRVYFLEPAPWSSHFPFVREITAPPSPAGQGWFEIPFGVLTNIPVVWLALAMPMGRRDRSMEERSILRGIVTAVALFFGICAFMACLFFSACIRYEVEFLAPLVLLAVVGILGLERTLATPGAWLAGRPARRLAARWTWGLLLSVSVAFNLLTCVLYRADGRYWMGVLLAQQGHVSEAIQIYEDVLRIRPDFAQAHNNLGAALEKIGRRQEAMGQYEQAVHIKPDYALAHYNLGVALGQAGKTQEAILHLKLALQLKPDYAEAHYSLGLAMAHLGRIQEAIGHWQQALRIRPDLVNADYYLGVALEQAGRVQEAIGYYEQALRIKPDFAEARDRLARLRAGQ
ncbi:MAG TPA: tetratricopeptide repeat protein [Verrucomicrobiae bacterium]|nr:tetratricopeptide repeat protein [Verrucomicrobiae bacterium]